MSDDPIKKRMARAKTKARDDLCALGYEVVLSYNKPVCLVAYRGGEVRLIKVCLDEASPADEKALRRFQPSPVVSRELWARPAGSVRFVITKL